jgi:SNF2 family DNA or RNA helicase
MTNVLRLQQISRGFVAGAVHTETGEKQTVEIDGPNPAVESLVDFLEDTPGKVIVWCRFKDDVYKIHRALTVAEIKHVLYTGDHKVQVRAELIDQFNNDPETKALIGIPGAGGIGVNMAAADTTAFYSHGYNWAERAQAIARMQDLDKPNPLLLVDFVAADTVDERCLELTTEKEDLAAVLTGDRLRAML